MLFITQLQGIPTTRMKILLLFLVLALCPIALRVAVPLSPDHLSKTFQSPAVFADTAEKREKLREGVAYRAIQRFLVAKGKEGPQAVGDVKREHWLRSGR
jgi:hypothetical protein